MNRTDAVDDENAHRLVHASAVAVGRRALLIRGPSGSGKSSLAISLVALGAVLVADDRVVVEPQVDGPPLVSAPTTIRGYIEARGLGLLAAPAAPPTPLAAVVDLATTETDRLPPERTTVLAGADLPLLHKIDGPHFPAALFLYLRGGRALT